MDNRMKWRRLLTFLVVTTAAMLLEIAIGASSVIIQKAKADVCALARVNPNSVALAGIQPDRYDILVLSFAWNESIGRFTGYWSLRRWEPLGYVH
jgi:hypothetical protein